jgi:hypothetical protein
MVTKDLDWLKWSTSVQFTGIFFVLVLKNLVVVSYELKHSRSLGKVTNTSSASELANKLPNSLNESRRVSLSSTHVYSELVVRF